MTTTASDVAKLSPHKLKELRDNAKLPYRVRNAASKLLEAKQADTIRAGYAR